MNRQLGISVLSLIASIAVYSFTRIYPPETLISFLASGGNSSSYAGISANVPPFFYTLSIGLLVGVFAPDLSSSRRHWLLGIALVLSLEISQHPSPAESISNWLATLMGGLTAFFLLTYLPKENHNALIR